MSLHDRDYYRDDDSGSWSEWLDTRGAATVIGITCAVFLLQLFSAPRGGDKPELLSRQELREKYPDIREKTTDGVRKYSDLYLPAVLSGEVWRVVTAFWVNDIRNLVGVIVSLLVIYFAGKMIEPIIGGKEFFVFYWYAGLFVMLGMLLGKVLEKNVFPQLLAWPFDAVFGTCGNTGPVTAIPTVRPVTLVTGSVCEFAIAAEAVVCAKNASCPPAPCRVVTPPFRVVEPK